MIIAVDFDGTLHTAQYPKIGTPTPYAKKYMCKLADDGHYIIINTCRSGDFLVDAVNWLLAHELPFHRVNDNDPKNTEKYASNSRKIYAHVYIDDRQIGGLPTWHEIYEYITEVERKYQDKIKI